MRFARLRGRADGVGQKVEAAIPLDRITVVNSADDRATAVVGVDYTDSCFVVDCGSKENGYGFDAFLVWLERCGGEFPPGGFWEPS